MYGPQLRIPEKIVIEFKKEHDDAVIPTYATAGSAGADLYSVETCSVQPGSIQLIDLGFSIAIPYGYEVQVRPRSGLALKHGITLMNAVGTVDSDYRGTMKVILFNAGKNAFLVEKGMRIAQMIVAPVTLACFEIVQSLDETERNGGFGSTGV